MNIKRAGKQTKAYWRMEAKRIIEWDKRWKWIEVQDIAVPAYATGWEDGVAWVKRNWKRKETENER